MYRRQAMSRVRKKLFYCQFLKFPNFHFFFLKTRKKLVLSFYYSKRYFEKKTRVKIKKLGKEFRHFLPRKKFWEIQG